MSQVRSLNDKRDPDAPITILQAMTDIARFEELLPEMAESTVILKLLKVGVLYQIFQATYWAYQKGITLEEVEDFAEAQEEIMEQVEGQRRAGLPEDMTLDNAEETIQKLESQGTLKKSNFDLKKVKELIEKAYDKKEELARVDQGAPIEFATGPAPTLHNPCGGCNRKEGLHKCGRCRVRFYCSQNCQKADWPKHKLECQAQRMEG